MDSTLIKIPTQFKIINFNISKNERIEIKIFHTYFNTFKVIPFHLEMNFNNSLVSEVVDLPIIPFTRNAFPIDIIRVSKEMEKSKEIRGIIKSQVIEIDFKEYKENYYYIVEINSSFDSLKSLLEIPSERDRTFLEESNKMIKKETAEKNFPKFLEKIHDWLSVTKLINKKVNLNDSIKIPPQENSNFQNIKDLNIEVFQILLYRLKYFLTNWEKKTINIQIFFSPIYLIYAQILLFEDEEYTKFANCLLVHCTRSYLETDIESADRGRNIINSNLILTASSIQHEEAYINDYSSIKYMINKAISISDSPRFKNTLKLFISKYLDYNDDLEEKVSESVNYFLQILSNIRFINKASFNGMCGVNEEIYISTNILEHSLKNSDSKDIYKNKLFQKEQGLFLVTIIHEFIHSFLRKVLKSWLIVSPRAKVDSEKIEAGYDLEELLFGAIITENSSKLKIIADENFWQNENMKLYDNLGEYEEELENSKTLNKRFSGISCALPKVPLLR